MYVSYVDRKQARSQQGRWITPSADRQHSRVASLAGNRVMMTAMPGAGPWPRDGGD